MKKESKNSENSNVIIKWLKKLFSVQFLEIVIGIAGLYLTYLAFIRDEPGELSLYNNSHQFSKDIRYVIFGFEIIEDSLDFQNSKSFPSLANFSNNELNDFGVLAEMQNNIGFKASESYEYYIEETDSILFDKVQFYTKRERIGFMEPVNFPLEKMETKGDELLFQQIKYAYYYQGVPEDIINMHYFIVGIPQQYRDDDGTIIDAECAFIKAIRPLLLQSIIEKIDSKQILIVFKDKYVEAPSKMELLSNEEINIRKINELQ